MCCFIIVWQNSLINSLQSADKVILITSWTKSIHCALQHALYGPSKGAWNSLACGRETSVGRLNCNRAMTTPPRIKILPSAGVFSRLLDLTGWVFLSSFFLKLCQSEWIGTVCLLGGWRASRNLCWGQIQNDSLPWNRRCLYLNPSFIWRTTDLTAFPWACLKPTKPVNSKFGSR